MRSASPRVAPNPAPTAASLFEHDSEVLGTEEDFAGDVNAAAVTVLVAVAWTVKVAVSATMAVFAMLVDVDPDVRL